MFFLRGALTRRPQKPRPQIRLDVARKMIVESNSDEVDAELQVVRWTLEHFTFSPAAVGEAVEKMPMPSSDLREVSRPSIYGELASVDTICLLARKQPLDEKALRKLLSLLGYAASEDFLSNLWGDISTANTEDVTSSGSDFPFSGTWPA